MENIRIYSFLALLLVILPIFNRALSKSVTVDTGLIEIPAMEINSDIEIKGILDFENNWFKREFPETFKNGMQIKLIVADEDIASGYLKAKNDNSAEWSILIGLNKLTKLGNSKIQIIKNLNFKIILVYGSMNFTLIDN